MGITALQLSAKVTADTKEAEAALDRVHDKADNASGEKGSGGLKGFLGHMLAIAGGIGIVSAVGGAVGFLTSNIGDMVQSGMSANEALAQTNAVLTSTHGVAGVTAGAVAQLADHYMNLTGIQDDTVRSTENVLLTFTNIGKNIFPQTTGAVLDMATSLHEDFQSAAIQVGKALQDPIQGVTALQRVGVKLTDQQKEQVAAMMKAGDTAGAQKIILAELNKEFGGSAEAAGKANRGL